MYTARAGVALFDPKSTRPDCLAVLAVMYIRVAPVVAPETRLEITTPLGRLSFSRISPAGRKVVFSAAPEGKPSGVGGVDEASAPIADRPLARSV